MLLVLNNRAQLFCHNTQRDEALFLDIQFLFSKMCRISSHEILNNEAALIRNQYMYFTIGYVFHYLQIFHKNGGLNTEKIYICREERKARFNKEKQERDKAQEESKRARLQEQQKKAAAEEAARRYLCHMTFCPQGYKLFPCSAQLSMKF